MLWHNLVLALVYGLAMPLACQAAERRACLDLRTPHASATVTGLLTMQSFSGPPNYTSITGGDAQEKVLILKLPARTCADDGAFIDSSTSFDRVQINPTIPSVIEALKTAVGRSVTVRGEAFGAQTGHHHAPLVLIADEVTVR